MSRTLDTVTGLVRDLRVELLRGGNEELKSGLRDRQIAELVIEIVDTLRREEGIAEAQGSDGDPLGRAEAPSDT